jgi:hypothetical protein
MTLLSGGAAIQPSIFQMPFLEQAGQVGDDMLKAGDMVVLDVFCDAHERSAL